MGRRRDYKGGKDFAATHDGFENFTAKLGLGQSNPLAAGGYKPGVTLTAQRQVLDAMYRTSWVVGRMVDVVSEDMVRGGIDIKTQLPPDEVDELHRYMRRWGVDARFSEAIKWGRLYGGAVALILINGANPSLPLKLDEVPPDSFRGLHVLDRHQIMPSTSVVRDLGPMLGYPEFYSVNVAQGVPMQRWHHSRVIRFVGVQLPFDERQAEQSWGASVVERAYDRILALDSSTHGAANLMLRSFLRVIKVDRLREILAGGGKAEAALTKMFDMIRIMQTSEGLTLLDKDDEFQTYNWSFAGMADGLQAFAEQIAGATGIPLVRLLGQSPKGFSTGESDLEIYYDTIRTQQDDDLRPAYEKLLPVCAMSKFGQPMPEGTQFSFKPLQTPSEVDKSTIATADAQGVAGLFAAGIIDEVQALTALREASRVTGRYAFITDEDIEAAEQAAASAPALGLPDLPELPATSGEES
jgi:phage-related protein (TIGR01555 family)